MNLKGKKILVGVCGSIAAYKACDLVRLFVKAGADVQVMMSRGAQEFVKPITFEGLSGRVVWTELFDPGAVYRHLDRSFDVVVVAPVTANTLGKMAGGLADDVVTASVLAAKCPVLLAPAMNPSMWGNRLVQRNVPLLRDEAGYTVMQPATGEMADGESGEGRLPELEDIFFQVEKLLTPQDLAGKRVLITAGPTREMIDPVRFVSNVSTGKMGYALAREAALRGAQVELVSGPVQMPMISGVLLHPVVSAQEMMCECKLIFPRVDAMIGSAAVADWSGRHISPYKLKKTAHGKIGGVEMRLDLVENPDILAELSAKKEKRVMIGFALETHDVIAHAREKLERKHVDMIVANEPLKPDMAGDTIEMTFVTAKSKKSFPRLNKSLAAHSIIDWLVQKL